VGAGQRRRELQPPPGLDLLAEAERFVALFHAENPEAGSPAERMRQVRREIKSGGTYRHTTAELSFAARVAWRNSARCIGRLYWRSLRVRDRRDMSTAAQIAAESFAHLRAATNGGRIRPLITVSLGLRWYAVPVISDMELEAGGICYPAAPFNGWYMCTEIGSRDLGDAARYNQLPAIANLMGLNSNDDRTLWKDRAVTELNVAVLHSFSTAG